MKSSLIDIPELTQEKCPSSSVILSSAEWDEPYVKYVETHDRDTEIKVSLLKTSNDLDFEAQGELIFPSISFFSKGDDDLVWELNNCLDTLVMFVYRGDADEILSGFEEYSSIKVCGKVETGTFRHEVTKGIVIESAIGYEREPKAEGLHLPINVSKLFLGDEPIGIACVHYSHAQLGGYYPTIMTIEILEAYRRMGYGSMLIEFLHEQARKQGFSIMGADYVQVHGFFDKHGYRYASWLKEEAWKEL